MKKRLNFPQTFIKITRFKIRISYNIENFAQIFPKQDLKYTIFFNINKRPKNCQMTKPFCFWQKVSKRPNLDDLAFKNTKWQPWVVFF